MRLKCRGVKQKTRPKLKILKNRKGAPFVRKRICGQTYFSVIRTSKAHALYNVARVSTQNVQVRAKRTSRKAKYNANRSLNVSRLKFA